MATLLLILLGIKDLLLATFVTALNTEFIINLTSKGFIYVYWVLLLIAFCAIDFLLMAAYVIIDELINRKQKKSSLK